MTNAPEKEVKVCKNAKHAKDKVELSKCIKWVLECISKFKKIVINAKGKDRLSLKAQNAKPATVKRLWKNKKLLKLELIKVFQIIIQLRLQEKVIKSQMPWQEI